MRSLPAKVRASILLLAGAAIGSVATLYLRPRPADAPSPFYKTPRAQVALERSMQEVAFRDLPLKDVVAQLAHQWGVPIAVDWTDIEQAGHTVDRRVTLSARDLTLTEALVRAFESSIPATGDARGFEAAVTPRGDRVEVRLKADSRPEFVWRVYDIAHLANRLAPPSTSDPTSNDTSGDEAWTGELVRFLDSAVVSNSWLDIGGRSGPVMNVVGTRLVVAQTWQNHRIIAAVLGELGRAPATVTAADVRPPAVGTHVAYVSDAQSALRRRTGPLDLVAVTPDEAARELGRRWQVPVLIHPVAFAPEPEAVGRKIEVQLVDPTLADAVRAVVRETGSLWTPRVMTQGGTVTGYAANDALAGYADTVIYDLRPLLDVPRTYGGRRMRRGDAEFFVRDLIQEVCDTALPDTPGNRASLHLFDGRLVVTARWESHEAVERLLAAMEREHPATPAAGE
jgi:hypothetical protein